MGRYHQANPSGKVLSNGGGAEHQATGAVPQPIDNAPRNSDDLAELRKNKLCRGILAIEETFS